MLYLDNELEIIKITFNKPIYKKINNIYFSQNKDIIYYDNNHLNYIYIDTIDNVNYTFYGFFKDNYFVIIFNSYNSELDVNIDHKQVILIKLDWVIKRCIDEKLIWILDKSKLRNLNSEAIILHIRDIFFNQGNISIEDYIKIHEYLPIKIKINIVNKIEKFNLKMKILHFLGLNQSIKKN